MIKNILHVTGSRIFRYIKSHNGITFSELWDHFRNNSLYKHPVQYRTLNNQVNDLVKDGWLRRTHQIQDGRDYQDTLEVTEAGNEHFHAKANDVLMKMLAFATLFISVLSLFK